MKVAILKADGFIRSGLDYAHYIAQVLEKAKIDFEVIDLTVAQPRIHDYSAFLLTGGTTSADAKTAWMEKTISTTIKLCDLANRKKIFLMGICLGSQIIANAFAGKILNRPSHQGMEYGPQSVQNLETGETFYAFEFHYEEIDETFHELPSVTLSCSNSHSLVQGYRIGHHIAAYQFHPEIPFHEMAKISAYNGPLLKKFGIDDTKTNQDMDIANPGFQNEKYIVAPLRDFFSG